MSAEAGESERSQIANRAGIVALGTLASRILGLGRDMALAAFFSRSATDAWLIAWQIPNLLRQVLAEGAVQTAVLPVLSQIREQNGDDAARSFFRAISGFFLVVLLLVSALGMIFAEELARMFAAGFSARPEQLELTAQLTIWVFPYIFFMGSAALGLAALNAHRRFVVTSFAPGLLNVSFLLCAIFLPDWLAVRGADAIFAMAVGGLAGGLLQVLAQWPSLRAIGYLDWPSFNFRHPGIALCLKRLAPTLLGIGVYAIDVMVGRRMLSSLPEGSVTYFTYALRLCDFSQGIFVMALSSATLPTLATFVARGDLEEVTRTLAFSLRLSLFIGLAATFASICLAEPIVAAIFQRGHFSQNDALETTRAFVAQAAGIFLVAGVRQLVIVFFALGKTLIPVYVAVIDILVFSAVGLGLRDTLGHVAISWGVTAARIVQFSLLWFALKKSLPPLPIGSIGLSTLKNLVSAALAAAAVWMTQSVLVHLPFGSGINHLIQLVVGGGLFCVVFFACASRLGSEELRSAVGPLKRRLGLANQSKSV